LLKVIILGNRNSLLFDKNAHKFGDSSSFLTKSKLYGSSILIFKRTKLFEFPKFTDLLPEIIEGQCLSFVKSAHDYADLIQSV